MAREGSPSRRDHVDAAQTEVRGRGQKVAVVGKDFHKTDFGGTGEVESIGGIAHGHVS